MNSAGARKDIGPLLFSGTPATRLGFGGWAAGGSGWGGGGGNPTDRAERLAAITLAVERGVTFFDTAPSYGQGESERLLGQALHAVRDRVTIATKVGPRDDPRASLEDSLRRLDSEYVDLVQLHEPLGHWESALETLDRLRREGKARAIGICNAGERQLARACAIAPLATAQSAYNLFDRDVEERDLPFCRTHTIAFLAYRPLASGLLSGKYEKPPNFGDGDHRRQIYWFRGREFERRKAGIARLATIAQRLGIPLAALALRWLLSRPGVTVVLAGARNRAQVLENLKAREGDLSPDVEREIDDLVRSVFQLPRASAAAHAQAAAWGPRERFIVERLVGERTAESIAAEWTDRGEQPMVAAQVKVFADALRDGGLVE